MKDLDKSQLVELSDDENRGESAIDFSDANDAATARVLEQIESASEEIDGYLRSAYSLPFADVPERIKQICKDIAIYNLYKRRQRTDMPESLTSIYKARIAELKDIQKGVISLGVESSETDVSEFHTNKTADDKIFTKDVLNQL